MPLAQIEIVVRIFRHGGPGDRDLGIQRNRGGRVRCGGERRCRPGGGKRRAVIALTRRQGSDLVPGLTAGQAQQACSRCGKYANSSHPHALCRVEPRTLRGARLDGAAFPTGDPEGSGRWLRPGIGVGTRPQRSDIEAQSLG